MAAAPPDGAADRGWLGVPTGGTSGAIRLARHDEQTLSAGVHGFVTHFGFERANAIDVLPPFHVSGLMARLRCAATGGTHVAWDWKRLEAGERPHLAAVRGGWMLSLVPTQLQRLLASHEATAWLREFAIVFLGGGPAWPELLDATAAAGVRVAPSYGMTETAAMVAALRPDDFLAGERCSLEVLPHARISLTGDGTITVESESVFLGYMPEIAPARVFATTDLGVIDARGRLSVLGRRDDVIITGGEKVNPLEVEAVLRGTGAFADVAVIGVPDRDWGQAVVACFPADSAAPDLERVRWVAEARLSGFKRPKRYVAVADWPRHENGKLDRSKLAASLRQAG